MIMNQSESMLSGGSAKTLGLQLELGVSNDLEDLTLLKSTGLQKTNLSKCLILLNLTLVSQSKRNNHPHVIYSSEASKNNGFLKIKQPEKCIHDCEHCYENEDVCEWIDYQPVFWLWDHIKQLALIRFFEIWGDQPRQISKIINGLGANKRIEMSITGLLGIFSQLGYISKNKNNCWVYDREKMANRIIPFNSKAINNCRTIAFSFADSKNIYVVEKI